MSHIQVYSKDTYILSAVQYVVREDIMVNCALPIQPSIIWRPVKEALNQGPHISIIVVLISCPGHLVGYDPSSQKPDFFKMNQVNSLFNK